MVFLPNCENHALIDSYSLYFLRKFVITNLLSLHLFFSGLQTPASFQFDCSFVEGYHLNFLCYKMSKQIDKQTGKKKTVITLSELEAIMNYPCFDDEENNFKGRINVVELPLATVDVVVD